LRSIDHQTTEVRVLRQLAKLRPANPTSIIAQLDGSGPRTPAPDRTETLPVAIGVIAGPKV